MRTIDVEQAIQSAFSSEDLRARIVNEGPVALSDVLEGLELREAAVTLAGRVKGLESELTVQRATDWWD